ncbi:MAG: type IV pilin protein [Gemmatimonadota bacterium]
MSRTKATSLISSRAGFTLIELLIVITIIGILAAIAVPKFGRTRERAHFKAMMSDLRNLQAMQELSWGTPANAYTYASVTTNLGAGYANSQGVSVTITNAGGTGWAATSAHAALAAGRMCAVFVGTVSAVPSPAATPGVVACTGD